MATKKADGPGRRIKYLGDSDIHIIEAGEDWGGRLADPISEELRWDWSNNHLATVNLPQAALDLLLEDSDSFVDVTDADVIPVAKVAARRRAIKSPEDDTQESVDLNKLNQEGQGAVGATPGSIGTGDAGGDAGQGSAGGSTLT